MIPGSKWKRTPCENKTSNEIQGRLYGCNRPNKTNQL
nr:MAG TPA: hypothetical protein [Bacteriophage sp.]